MPDKFALVVSVIVPSHVDSILCYNNFVNTGYIFSVCGRVALQRFYALQSTLRLFTTAKPLIPCLYKLYGLKTVSLKVVHFQTFFSATMYHHNIYSILIT